MTTDFDKMINFDALAEAEKITGKSYKDDEETSNLGLVLHMAQGRKLQAELELRDDTHYGSEYEDALRIYLSEGFAVVHNETFETGGRMEHMAILWHPEGILAKLTSWHGRQNNSEIWANWVPRQQKMGGYTSSGRFWSSDWEDKSAERVWIGHWDGRTGLRNTLSNLRGNGRFLSQWAVRPMMLNLLNYEASKVLYKSVEDKPWEERHAEVEARLSEAVKLLPLALWSMIESAEED